MAKNKGQFKPGNKANPKGRPKKGYSITEWFREMLNNDPKARDKIGRSIYKKALEGDTAAQRLVWGYMDGQPKIVGEIQSEVTVIFHNSLEQDEAEPVPATLKPNKDSSIPSKVSGSSSR